MGAPDAVLIWVDVLWQHWLLVVSMAPVYTLGGYLARGCYELLRGEGFHAETFYAENFRYGAVTRAEFVPWFSVFCHGF